MVEHNLALEREKEDKWKEGLDPEERDSLEHEEDFSEEMDEKWHADLGKTSETTDNDWEYINKGFDKDMDLYTEDSTVNPDYINDIQTALTSWRTSLNNNHVLDDLLGHSQDVPTATAYGDLMRLINEYDDRVQKDNLLFNDKLSVSLKKLKGTATRMNESMMKTAAECYSDIDEDVTYRDLTIIGRDPVSYKMRRSIQKQNKRVFERLNSYDDEIRGEKNMSSVIAAFVPEGQGDKWTTDEKSKCDKFIDDYVSRDVKRRIPYLEMFTNKMMDLAISLDMFTPEYLTYNMDHMAYLLTQVSYFEDIRNDPANAYYFQRLPEKKQKKLDIIDRIGTSFTPGDFVSNIIEIGEREDMYKPDATDQIRVDEVMSKGDTNANVEALSYDTKQYIASYKRDRY